MPRRNKRKIFGKSNKSNKNKSNQSASSSSESQQQQRQHERDSEEKCDGNASAGHGDEEDDDGEEDNLDVKRKSELASLVANDSAPTMGQLESVATRWEGNSNAVSEVAKEEHKEHKATITLKVIQFVGDVPSETRGDESDRHKIDAAAAETNETESVDNIRDNKSITVELLHNDVVGAVPRLDHNKAANETSKHSFDDNYRVESPKQICIETTHPTQQQSKRHAMLIQEISESSSSEEVKQFLDTEATALEMKVEIAPSPRQYRVELPESDDNNNHKVLASQRDDAMVQEISESSSSESVKNEILASMSRQSPTQKFDSKPILKIINIKELPEENVSSANDRLSSLAPTKINIFECKTEKKLNKAEEAILEALYGNKSLLQVSHLPLDVISEEGSECGSDIVDKQSSNKAMNDDDVFLPSSVDLLSKKPPRKVRREEQPLFVINTKIIETELNIPEGCKSWETKEGDNELQAELVYLTSTSSSATDLSERGDITDTDESSEDTETNSLLENISVPSLDNFEHDTPIEIRFSQPSPAYSSEYYNEQKLADIIEEEDEEQVTSKSLDIIESQQQIEDVNKELHHLVSEHEENQTSRRFERASSQQKQQQQQQPKDKDGNIHEDDPETINCDNECDKAKKVLSESERDKDSSNRVTPTLSRRKNSSDSSSSANSQCTVRLQASSDHQHVDPLKDLCMQSLVGQNGFTHDKDMSGEGKITVQRRLNSLSRNAPEIPIMSELELHYECDNDSRGEGRETSRDRVITILQVPPEINSVTTTSSTPSPDRWIGLQSTQIPNLMLALSPMQNSYMMSSQDANTSADVLLDMHKKFVERRAYHEADEPEAIENSQMNVVKVNESQLEPVDHRLEEGYFGDRENSVDEIESAEKSPPELDRKFGNCDKEKKDENENIYATTSSAENKSSEGDRRMNSIRNFILRDEFFKNPFVSASRDDESSNRVEGFEVKKFELENELKRLDSERRDLEEELKNLQSLQHFKREEFLYNEKKLQEKIETESESPENRHSSANEFNEFVNSNERLQQELYNEWQDKVLERYERKLQKTIKITSITETTHHDHQSERAASETLRVVPLENEFMTKLKERQKRLSLPTETELNSSTESLHHQNEEIMKSDKKLNIPAHLHEFLKYYEDELAQSKNSDESGECRKTNPLLIGLIAVSMSLCAFYIGKYLITQR